MKFITLGLGFTMLFLSATCSSTNNLESMELTGEIEKSGITSYQYGTHILSVGEAFHALKSETVDLDKYVGKTVTIEVERVDGYPIDGGPLFYEVLEVE